MQFVICYLLNEFTIDYSINRPSGFILKSYSFASILSVYIPAGIFVASALTNHPHGRPAG